MLKQDHGERAEGCVSCRDCCWSVVLTQTELGSQAVGWTAMRCTGNGSLEQASSVMLSSSGRPSCSRVLCLKAAAAQRAACVDIQLPAGISRKLQAMPTKAVQRAAAKWRTQTRMRTWAKRRQCLLQACRVTDCPWGAPGTASGGALVLWSSAAQTVWGAAAFSTPVQHSSALSLADTVQHE